MPTQYNRPEQVLDKIYQLVNDNKGYIGLAKAQYADETFIVEYPCGIVAPNQTTTEDHGTHTYLRTFETLVYILHAKLMVDRSVRTREDLQMVTRTIEKIEEVRTLEVGSNVVKTTVVHESPDVVAYKREPVVGTRLLVETEARVRWR